MENAVGGKSIPHSTAAAGPLLFKCPSAFSPFVQYSRRPIGFLPAGPYLLHFQQISKAFFYQ
jgi:hypothetical protein